MKGYKVNNSLDKLRRIDRATLKSEFCSNIYYEI